MFLTGIQRQIIESVAYHVYFGMKFGDQDKVCVPHMVCETCTKYLPRWTKGKKSCVKFGIPMVEREPTNHVTDYYFCAIDVAGIHKMNRISLRYPDLESACRPVAHCDKIPISASGELIEISDEDFS